MPWTSILFEALRLIAREEKTHPREVVARLVRAAVEEKTLQAAVLKQWETLSPREKQVAALVCRGWTSRQIAALLQISPTTVKTHAENVQRKFGASNREAFRQMLSGWDLSQYE